MRNSDFSELQPLTTSELSSIMVNPFLKLEDIIIPTDMVFQSSFTPKGIERKIPYLQIRVSRERIEDGQVYRKDILIPLRWFVTPTHMDASDVVNDIKGKRFRYEGWPPVPENISVRRKPRLIRLR